MKSIGRRLRLSRSNYHLGRNDRAIDASQFAAAKRDIDDSILFEPCISMNQIYRSFILRRIIWQSILTIASGFFFFLVRRREIFVVKGKDCFVESTLNIYLKSVFLFLINIGLEKIFHWLIFIIR